jgi:hypothetical protein
VTTYAEAHQYAQKVATRLAAPFAVIVTDDPTTPFDVFSAKVAVKAFPEYITTIVAPAT